VAQNRGADNIVERLRFKVWAEVLDILKSHVAALRLGQEFTIENCSGDRIFAAQNLVNVFGPDTLPAPNSSIVSPGKMWKEWRTVSARQRNLVGDVPGYRSQ
jgi:hypothetical protein